jgi:hypothetical protein
MFTFRETIKRIRKCKVNIIKVKYLQIYLVVVINSFTFNRIVKPPPLPPYLYSIYVIFASSFIT